MDKKTEYVESLSAQMVKWDVQIDLLKDKAKSGMSGANLEYTNAVEALQIKRDEAAVKLQGISTASDHEWEELKAGTELVWGEVRSILRDAIMKV